MAKCDCGSELEVLYICKTPKCKSHYLTYYCLRCSQDESKHDHRPVAIVLELESQTKKWNDLKIEMTTTYEEVKKRYCALEPVIGYMEQAMMDPEATFEQIEVQWISA